LKTTLSQSKLINALRFWLPKIFGNRESTTEITKERFFSYFDVDDLKDKLKESKIVEDLIQVPLLAQALRGNHDKKSCIICTAYQRHVS